MSKALQAKISRIIRQNFIGKWLLMTSLSRSVVKDDLTRAEALLDEVKIATTAILTRSHTTNRGYLPTFLSERPVFNPSVARWAGRFVFVVKSPNYRCAMDGAIIAERGPVQLDNYIYSCGETFERFEMAKLDDGLVRRTGTCAVDGIADIRLFVWKESLWGIGAGIKRLRGLEYSATQMLFRIEAETVVEVVPLPSPNRLSIEKNWTPLVLRDELYLVYGISPFIVYKFTGLGLVRVRGDPVPSNDFDVRGGTPFVGLRGKYVALIHFRAEKLRGKLFYRHAFAVVDGNLNLEELSEPFFLQRKGMEFATGLEAYRDGLIASYGVSDRGAAFCELSLAQLREWIVI
jgi:hypothetical protein